MALNLTKNEVEEARTELRLGMLYQDKNDYPAAIDAYGKALEIYKRFAKINSDVYEPDVAGTLNSLGTLYHLKNDFPAAVSANMPADRFGTAEEMLKKYLSKGLNNNQKNKGFDGLKPRTPLELAFNSGYGTKTSVMLALINNGADVKLESQAIGPMMLQAAQSGSVDLLKIMIEKGGNINANGKFFAQADA